MKLIGTRGMTLPELLLVVCIITIIAGLASLSTGMIRRERVASTARELYADLQKARLDAMTRDGKGFGIRLESPHAYVLFKFDDCDQDYSYDHDSCPGGTREEAAARRKSFHSSIAIQYTTSSPRINSDVRIFDRFGSPRKASWALGNVTIMVKSIPDAGLMKCVSISTNRIREGVWSGSKCK